MSDRSEQYNRRCVVCQTRTEPVVVWEKWGYPILRCDRCGVGWTYVGNEFDATSLYNRSYFEGGQKDGYADYLRSESVLRIEFRRALAQLRRHGTKGGRLLEVGCAYGFFLLEAQRYFECSGIEISDDATKFCRSRGLDVRFGTVTEDLITQGPFDAVVMLDCVEHLVNPGETLAILWHALSKRGSLMISTGDWASFLACVMGRRWRLMTPPQHLFFFSRRTLTSLLAKTGFRVVHYARPWKIVPLGLIAYQLGSRLRFRLPSLELLNSVGIPVNLFDAVRLVARKQDRP